MENTTVTHLRESDVVDAANAIAAQGEIPTISAVRARLQGRGSETTILNHLRKWKIRLLGFAVYCEAEEISPDFILNLQQQYTDSLKQLEIQTEKVHASENALAHFKTENMVLMHGVKRLNNQISELQKVVIQQQMQIESLQQLNTALHTVDELVSQKVLNSNLQDQLRNIKAEIQGLLVCS